MPAKSPGLILDATGNPYRVPRDPLVDGSKARAHEVFRDLPIHPLLEEWSVTDIRLALNEHAMGLFLRSSILIDAIIGDDRVQSAIGSRVGALLGLDEVYTAGKGDTSGEVVGAG